MLPMSEDLNFSVAERREAKRRSREHDLARLQDGLVNVEQLQMKNGFFSALDPLTARILVRSAHVNLGAFHR